MAFSWWKSDVSHVWVMGELRAAYTELRFFGKTNEPSRYRPRQQRISQYSRNHPTPDRFPSEVYCFFTWSRKWCKTKKEKRCLWFIAWSLGYFIVCLNPTGKRKKERLSSLSISCIKDGCANANLQGAHPPVIVYRLNWRATVPMCVEFCGVCVCVCI